MPDKGAIAADFAPLAAARKIVLAVSGGPDSLALLLLAARWAAAAPDAPALHVATIDHGLRPESAGEAAFVAREAAALGLPHAILRWEGDKPVRRIQELAREARYRLLAGHARAIAADAIVTAHHAEDQAETILFRLTRGSGVAGLAGMARVSTCAGLPLHRPLLDWRKADLVAVCEAEGRRYLEDPSNSNPAYARARLRALAATLAEQGLDAPALARLGRRAARASAALESWTDSVAAGLPIRRDDGATRLDARALAGLPEEIALRLIEREIRLCAGLGGPVRLERLEALAQRLLSALRAEAPLAATLGGVLVALDKKGQLLMKREPARRRGRKSLP